MNQKEEKMKRFCVEPLNVVGEPLAMFTVWVDGQLHPKNCYMDKNKTVSLTSIELFFPYENWKKSNFYPPDDIYPDCLGECVAVEHEEMSL